jgi:hypothetical protein
MMKAGYSLWKRLPGYFLLQLKTDPLSDFLGLSFFDKLDRALSFIVRCGS